MKADAMQLKESYRQCEAIMKKGAVNFYHAFKHMDTNRFEAITAVYAFCRYVDDVVDENEDQPKRMKLGVLENLKNILSGNANEEHHIYFASENPWFLAFWDTYNHFDIPLDALIDQIDGQIMDLNFQHFTTQDELYRYCSLVAGSVGRMLLPMLATNISDDLFKVCDDLGIAMQITNILRDIGEDYKNRRRIYIPKEILNRYSFEEAEFDALTRQKVGKIPNKVIELWESLAQEASWRYDALVDNINLFDLKAQLPLLLAAENYRAILDAVRIQDYNCFTKRCYTSAMKRVEILAKAKKTLKEIHER